MAANRQDAYLALIQQLLACPSGQEPEILQANRELLDHEFVVLVLAVAAQASEAGEAQAAQFLVNLAEQVAQVIGMALPGMENQRPTDADVLMDFWMQLLQAELNSGGAAAVHRVMRDNPTLVTPVLGQFIVEWTQGMVAQHPAQAEMTAGVVEDICNSIQQFPYGKYVEVLEIALQGYEVVLALRVDNPEKRSQTLNNQGNARLTQAELGIDPTTNIERALILYEESARIRRDLNLDRELSGTLINQGNARFIQAELGIKPVTNLAQAIAAYEEAAQISRRLGLDRNLSRTLNNQATVHLTQAELGIDPASNLDRAIAACQEAAQIRRRLGLEGDFAQTLMNQGNAHRTQAELGIEPASNLDRAIAAYEESAQIMRRLGLERDLSGTLTNQGNAHRTQAQLGIDPAANLERAITAYGEAAEIQRRLGIDRDLASTLVNQATARRTQALLRIDPATNLDRAIAAYEEAAQIMRRLDLERDLSTTLNNQGNAHRTQAELGIDPATNLVRAITAYDESAQIRRRLGLDRDLASTLHNWGNTYQTLANQDGLSQSDRQTARQNAIPCYREALTYFNPQVLPVETLKTARTLGNLHFRQGNWQLALDEGYLKAIAAVEQTRSWALSEARRQEIQAQASELYLNTVQAYVELGQYDQALALSERARSRRLVELFATKDLYRDGNIPPQIQTYLDQYFALENQINALQQDLDRPDGDRSEPVLAGARRSLDRAGIAARSDAIAQLETQKQALWQAIYTYDPETAAQLQVSPLNFAAMRALLQAHPRTAILNCFSTPTATHLFILYPPNDPGPNGQGIACHTCPGQDYQTLRAWLAENWLVPYLDDRPTWQARMPQVLAELSDRLQINTLIDTYLQDIDELIIIPHLFLHQIPFAALPIANPPSPPLGAGPGVRANPPLGAGPGVRVLGDRFRLHYVPNTQILHFCQQRPPIPAIEQRAIVEDATDDLPCARFEGEYIAQLFGNQVQRRLRGKTEATTDNYRQLLHDPSIQAIVSAHHAESRLDQPLESLLLLGDGAITLGYLFSPACRIPHLDEIILSCCETGLGADLESAADDVVTLAAGFLCAGARSVLSSLWSVDDLATALFAMRYHRHRQAGCDRPTALQQAQQDLRTLPGTALSTDMNTLALYLIDAQNTAKANGDTAKAKQLHPLILRLRQLTTEPTPPFAAPHHWAAFVCHGLA